MDDCLKRQREDFKGTERSRCLNHEATTHLQIVTTPQCESCPVKVLRKLEGPPCKQKPLVENQLPILQQHEGYPECPYRFQSVGGYTCSVTGLPVTPEICGRCDEETRATTATWGDKAINYLTSIRRWVAQGQPMRTAEEIEKLFAEHCANCERYDKESHGCKTCGCSVSATTMEPLDNKLRMGSEHCPLGRF